MNHYQGLNYQGLMELATQKAKEEAKYLYPDDDKRQKIVEIELTSKYYKQYTTP